MKIKNKIKNQTGQALVTLLFVVVIGITIITAAVIIIFQNIKSSSITEQGVYAYYVAESGIEEGILRLLRNPLYTGTAVGQPFVVGQGSAVISVDGGGIITSQGTYNDAVRKIQVKTLYNNGMLTITSWKEEK
jgi:type II secretory pathway component PulK